MKLPYAGLKVMMVSQFCIYPAFALENVYVKKRKIRLLHIVDALSQHPMEMAIIMPQFTDMS